MKRNKGFTLIELIAVLVILAIIALIVTPLVMNIVKKAKDSANKRSVDAYGKAVELAVATHLLDNGEYPADLKGLTIEYSGNEVVCNIKTLNEDGSIYLSECSVKGTEVKDSSTEDGWYHYGKTTSIAPITPQAYNVGDVVTYNGMDFYVIAPSDENSDRVTMLKAEPLTVDEVNTYGAGHINMYATSDTNSTYYQKAYDQNGYGAIYYYTSIDCGYNGNSSTTSCITEYDGSDVKYVIDAWSADKIKTSDLIEDAFGYKARLINSDDLVNNLDCPNYNCGDSRYSEFIYNSNYGYWTMIGYDDQQVRFVYSNGGVWSLGIQNNSCIRPVVTILKSAI